MRQCVKLLGTSAIVLTLGVGAVMAQEACKSYRVAPGDTLLKIAQKAYGNDEYRMVYDANVDRIGSNPNLIEVGLLLRLPCADGTMAEATPVVVPEATEAAKEAAASDEGPIVLITGNDFPPFTDEGLPGRGVFTQLVETAAFRSNPEKKVDVKFVNDWDSHLDLLLPVLAFNGSFPWSKPDCDQPDALSEHDKNRCENYNFSDPFYEVVDGFFARTGSGYDTTLKYEELFGTRICRPEGYSTAHLDAVGLSEPMIKMYRPAQVRDCFDGLMAGSIDVIALDSMVAADTISTLGLTDQVVENPNLGAVKELYVLVHKNHPRGQETLDLLNAGLREMVNSGEWYDIVSTALQRQMTTKIN
jgi:polar amino acid transport system substrate-binding protein